ncbi:MAG: hypothetical protein QOG97_3306 [Acidimicrobiaceae bacterium]|jgi:hypothetical protein|nr:hypothetical protein [Acidimicrobiaceae bacterium]
MAAFPKAAGVSASVVGIIVAMRSGDGRFRDGQGARHRDFGRRGGLFGTVATLAGVVAIVALGACSNSKAAVATTTIATTTTSTTLAAVSQLTVVGVRPAVLQAPFYPQLTVTQVSCGKAPQGGRFVRVDLPAGGAGTPAKSVLTQPTAVIVVSGGAVLVDPRYITRVLYAESMKSITTATHGAFVLTLGNLAKTGGDGLSVVVGNVQVNGDYECPGADVAFPGT